MNVEIFKELQSVGILADHAGSALLVLQAIYEDKLELLDEFDDGNTNKNSLTIYMELCKAGYIKREKNNSVNFVLTEMGAEFMGRVLGKTKIVEAKPEDWVAQYRMLWVNPKTAKFYQTPDKRNLGGSLKDLTAKMKRFLTDYRGLFQDLPEGLTIEKVILESTKMYIEDKRREDFKYTKDAFNFIFKQEGTTKDTTRSLLATYCENYIANYGKEPPRNKFMKIINL